MCAKPRVFVALPAYNEEAALPELLDAVARELYATGLLGAVVIVDDGSTDGTGRVIEEWSSRLPIATSKHQHNRGLGETVADALRRAAALAAASDAVVTMDADNTHSPALVREMLDRLQHGFDLVIASRYQSGAEVRGLGRFRHWMSDGARLLFRIGAPMDGVRDYTSGFRAYRAGLLQQAFARYGDRFITERGFACMAEILINLRPLAPRVCEVPLVLRYDRKQGRSKMRVGRTVFQTLRLLARARLTRARPECPPEEPLR